MRSLPLCTAVLAPAQTELRSRLPVTVTTRSKHRLQTTEHAVPMMLLCFPFFLCFVCFLSFLCFPSLQRFVISFGRLRRLSRGGVARADCCVGCMCVRCNQSQTSLPRLGGECVCVSARWWQRGLAAHAPSKHITILTELSLRLLTQTRRESAV